MKRLKLNLNLIGALVTSALLYSCDFTPRFHKRILQAQEYLTIHDYKNALNQYKLILRDNPSDEIKLKVNYQLGEVLSINLGDNSKALTYYEKAKLLTEDPLWHVKIEERIAEISFNFLRDYRKSIQSYKNLVEFKPKLNRYDYYQYRLGLSYLMNHEYSKSEEVFKEIQKNSGHEFYVNSYYQLGILNFERKNWKVCIVFWAEYIKRERRRDSVVKTMFLMANVYETMESLTKAYNIYYSILGEYPNTEVIQNRLNSIYARRVARKR